MRPGATRARGPALLARCARALPLLAALAAALFFARRAWFGLTAIGFNDETMHLLGGWALDSGERLYRNFDDVHGPGIFMLMQAYGALFGWAHANGARLVIAGLAVLAGLAVGTSPGLQGARRWCAVALYFGLLATVWLTQGLYLVSYYPISGAFAVMVLAWFVVPACARTRVPRPAAAAAGVACALLAFTSFQQAPTAVLFSAGGCLAAWRGGQPRAVAAHLAGVAASGVLLLAWLLRWGDLRGYLALHVYFGLVVYPQFGPVTLRSFLASLVPSLETRLGGAGRRPRVRRAGMPGQPRCVPARGAGPGVRRGRHAGDAGWPGPARREGPAPVPERATGHGRLRLVRAGRLRPAATTAAAGGTRHDAALGCRRLPGHDRSHRTLRCGARPTRRRG